MAQLEEVDYSFLRIASSILDVIKLGLNLFLLVSLFSRLIPSNKHGGRGL
jgi:hypothetical protein